MVARWVGVTLAVVVLGCTNRPAPPAVFEDIHLVDHHAVTLDAASLSGQALLVNFLFTSCPEVCPRQTEALASVRASLPMSVRERVRFLSISVDPEHDTPAVLQRFARLHHALEPGWSFARSDAESTARLLARFAASPGGEMLAASAHSTALHLFDARGRLVQRYRGAPIDVAHLTRELAALAQPSTAEARWATR